MVKLDNISYIVRYDHNTIHRYLEYYSKSEASARFSEDVNDAFLFNTYAEAENARSIAYAISPAWDPEVAAVEHHVEIKALSDDDRMREIARAAKEKITAEEYDALIKDSLLNVKRMLKR